MTSADGRLAPELVVDARAVLGEGPAWDAGRGVLWWVDITAGLVHGFDPRTGEDRATDVGAPVGAVVLRRDGRLLAALAEGLAELDPDDPPGHGPGGSSAGHGPGGSLDVLLRLGAPGDGVRCNDGKCDPAGRFLVDRMAIDAAPGAGALLSVDAGLGVTMRLPGLTIPNGLGWSPDGRRMYFVDSTWGEVRVFPYELATGALGDGRPLARLADYGGVPDGLTVDAEGHLWVAIWGGSRVVRLTPDGAIVDVVELPVSRVTSCTFGGPDLGDLYITTARAGASPAELAAEPYAGGLFRVRPGVRGVLPVRFAG